MLQEQHIPRYSYADYAQWEGNWELINGYPFAISPSPALKHQRTSNAVSFIFNTALKESKVSCNCEVVYEIDWHISDDTVVRPDIMIICGKHPDDQPIRIPPVLIVEIFLPATRLKDRNTKFQLYEQAGVKFYLMVDPDLRTIEIFQLVDNRYAQQDGLEQFALTSSCSLQVSLATIFS